MGSRWRSLFFIGCEGYFARLINISIEKKLTVIDLFAGAGGFGLGFDLASYNVAVSLETDQLPFLAYAPLMFGHLSQQLRLMTEHFSFTIYNI